MSEKYNLSETFSVDLFDGETATFAFYEYIEWLKYCDFLTDEIAKQEAYDWIKKDRFTKLNAWLSITIMRRYKNTIH